MIGILTFHRSHNYGSALQAFALQYWLREKRYKSEIIDLYTEESKKLYKNVYMPRSAKEFLRISLFCLLYKKNNKKWNKFYSFESNCLKLSDKTYTNINELLLGKLEYTAYITGSDQIWNTSSFDFSWAYFLPFLNYECCRISYAASFGAVGEKEQIIRLLPRIREYLQNYDYISVRENGSAKVVEKLIGKKPCITIDPTLLLSKEIWADVSENQSNMKLPQHYIFFYSLRHMREEYMIVKKIAAKMKLPVVITNVSARDVLRGFTWKIDAGPWDFIYLIQHADLVLTSSFHGTAFSIIFEKLFYSINGAQDNRISSLLKSLDISERAISLNNFDNAISKYDYIDYVDVKKRLSDEIQQSEEFLYTALKGEENGDLSS